MNFIQRLKSSSLPLSVRLGLTLMLITAISMGVVTSGLLFGVSWYESQRRADELESQADFYQAFASELVADNGNLQAAAPALVTRSVSGGVAVRVFGTAGQIFAASGPSGLFPSRAVAPLLASSVPRLLLSEDRGRRYSARRIERDGIVLGVVEVSQSLAEEQRLFRLLGRVASQSTTIALCAAIIGAVIVARWLGRMIGGLRVVAERIAGGDLKVRAAERGPHEIVSLTRALNAMADQLQDRLARLESQAETQRRFYRDVSHELRTPLMALGGYLENLEDAPPGPEQDHAIAALQGEVARLARLADELLHADNAPAITINPAERVDLATLARELVTNLGGRANRGGVELTAEIAGSLIISGSRDRLKQALINLLDNALRSTPPGGAITVSGQRRGEWIELAVRDSGPGVPPELRDAVWQRGVRGADGGSGLGLAIVRAIAEAHGGSASLAPTERGATFVLRFPLPSAAG